MAAHFASVLVRLVGHIPKDSVDSSMLCCHWLLIRACHATLMMVVFDLQKLLLNRECSSCYAEVIVSERVRGEGSDAFGVRVMKTHRERRGIYAVRNEKDRCGLS